ncbi:MAG: Eco57I restriction-modification methylase domain-containing protein [Muribaculaceae bacterium]|nr:Eco57I restriction-modification methylase domain-containing protein [Muribaculaceae bacterium]
MIKKSQFLNLIRQGNFKELFISELGWNRYRGYAQLPSISVDEKEYNISAIAERNGFQILYCEVDEIPTQSLAKKIDTKLRRQALDYICIFRLLNSTHDLWVVPVRTNEKRDLVIVEYDNANAEVLYQKIDGMSFDFDEETNIVDLRSKVQSAFAVNSEKITKDFYAGFKKQHKAFAEFITGIDDYIEAPKNKNKQWYASVMLNRLMFCYFIQKKGFLNFNVHYLREKLNEVRAQEGENKFYNFYRSFLRRLFQDGLNTPTHTKYFIDIFGKIPYLNGGMFDQHQLEADYADIDIPDEAFIGLFDFFDKWNWHLDTRLTASGKDINPDVLGYIFEQYINDRAQMGAYYTKEDITEYIARNCILPFLFDKVRTATAESPKAFVPDGFVWKTLRESGDRYIFDAVKKGYKDFSSIPESVSRGLITEEMRKEYSETPIAELPETHVPLSELRSEWNTRTPEQWGLPNEIWRETIERLQRCDDILGKIKGGEITSINDFITCNLDIRTFAAELLAKADNRFVGWFYHALQEVSILDPTCGSGAFLFAAMNILEPLYEICIDRMQEFNHQNPMLFKAELAEITDKYRSNIQYFIFKSIILRNLYGVDIMVEATEIAKLRLFLKMVAVVDVDRRADNLGLDPLPDIDFNIRCGNTLVGYANEKDLTNDLTVPNGDLEAFVANEEFKLTIEEEMRNVARAYEIFKDIQLRHSENMSAFKQAKSDLRVRLNELNDKLNRRLHAAMAPVMNYNEWLTSHQPFNWLADFYQIIKGNHGFDVIIGNPPYVETSIIERIYSLKTFKTEICGNIYACVIEKCTQISSNNNIGMIVQLPICCTDRMIEAQNILKSNTTWIYTFDDRPGKLFDGLQHIRATILLMKGGVKNIFTSKYNRWYSESRDFLFQNLSALETSDYLRIGSFPKIQDRLAKELLKKLSLNKPLIHCLMGSSQIYVHNAPQYFTRITTFKPYFWNERDGVKLSVSVKPYNISPKEQNIICALLNSNIFYLWFVMHSDCRHLNRREIENFPYNLANKEITSEISNLCDQLMTSFKLNSNRRTSYLKTSGKIEYDEYFPKLSKSIIDEIDKLLAKHYGFTDEELDFIINYDIKYRMGDELNNSKE